MTAVSEMKFSNKGIADPVSTARAQSELAGLGVSCTGVMVNADYHKDYDHDVRVDWTDDRLKRITRLRLLSDPGYPVWDVSYCHGVLKDGTKVHVDLPFSQAPKRGFKTWLYKEAKKTGKFIPGLFDAVASLC